MDVELDPTFAPLSEEEERILRENVSATSSDDSDDADEKDEDEDESYFTLEELTAEFNEVKATLAGLAVQVGSAGSPTSTLPPLKVLYDVKCSIATHYGTLEDIQYELDSLYLATAEDKDRRKGVVKELEEQFNGISIIGETCEERIRQTAELRKNDGNDLFKAGKFEACIEMYSTAISINPNNPLFYTNRALAYSRVDKYAEAIDDTKEARSRDVNFLKSYVIQTKCQLATGRVEDACATLDSAPLAQQSQHDVVELRELVSAAAKDAGNTLFKGKDMDGAVRMYTIAIACAPENHLLYSNRSAAYQAKGQWKSALQDAEKCVHINEYFPKGYLHMCRAELQLQRWDDAVSTVDMAESVLSDLDGFEVIQPQLDGLMRRALAGKQGQGAGPARPAAANTAVDNSTRAEHFKQRGNEYYKSEDYQEAIRYYSQAIALSQSEGTYYGNRAASWVMLREFQRAVGDCVEGLQHEKTPGQLDKLRQRQAAALGSTGAYDRALAVLQEALVLEGRGEAEQEAAVRTFSALIEKLRAAMSYLEQGKESVAKGEYSRSKRLFENAIGGGLSDDPAALVGLAKACLGLEDYEEASRQAQKVIAGGGGSNSNAISDAYVVRAAALQATGCTDLAAKHLTAALQRDPDNAEIIQKLRALRGTIGETQRLRGAVDAAMNARKFEEAIKLCGDGMAIDRSIKKLVSEFYSRRAKAHSMLAKQQRRMESTPSPDAAAAAAGDVPNHTASWKKCLQDAHTAMYYDSSSKDTVITMFLKVNCLFFGRSAISHT
jgi:tetratricopeptide (TPR) repeat protein